MWPLGNMDVRATTRTVVPSNQVEQIACRFAAMDRYAGTPAPRKLTGITPTSGLPLIGRSARNAAVADVPVAHIHAACSDVSASVGVLIAASDRPLENAACPWLYRCVCGFGRVQEQS